MHFHYSFPKISSSSKLLSLFLALSPQSCASSVRSVNLSVPATSLTAHPLPQITIKIIIPTNIIIYWSTISSYCLSVWFYQQEFLIQTYQRHFEQSKKANTENNLSFQQENPEGLTTAQHLSSKLPLNKGQWNFTGN